MIDLTSLKVAESARRAWLTSQRHAEHMAMNAEFTAKFKQWETETDLATKAALRKRLDELKALGQVTSGEYGGLCDAERHEEAKVLVEAMADEPDQSWDAAQKMRESIALSLRENLPVLDKTAHTRKPKSPGRA